VVGATCLTLSPVASDGCNLQEFCLIQQLRVILVAVPHERSVCTMDQFSSVETSNS
jgi:hypothetical protein